MKACPFCAEQIQDAAIVCKHCRQPLTPSTAPVATIDAAKAPRRVTAIEGIGAATILGGLIALYLVGPVVGFVVTWIGIGLCLRGGAIVRAGGGLLLAGVVVGIVSAVSPPAGGTSRFGAETVSLGQFNGLHAGDSYQDVVLAIGASGTELSRTTLGGTTTVMYSWKNANGSNMTAMFQNDRLISKAQFGLR